MAERGVEVAVGAEILHILPQGVVHLNWKLMNVRDRDGEWEWTMVK